jgi:GDP-mannose 6-dehydrogenase
VLPRVADDERAGSGAQSGAVKLLVWGLGYVGTVSAACLAQSGHEVVGIEPMTAKVDALLSGHSAIKEPKLDAAITDVVSAGRLRATADPSGLVAWADASLVCVGTPSSAEGRAQLDGLLNVAGTIGDQLADGGGRHVVIVRSTVFPGTTRGVVREVLESRSGLSAGDGFGLAMNPEFLRETSAIDDFYAPPFTVVGAFDERSGAAVADLYEDVEAPVYQVDLEQAEMLKLVCNAFHALKVGFANEIGRVCDALGMDSRKVMEMMCADTKLNISQAYLRPGFAFGGSCLPKDLRALTVNARRLGTELPILDAILPSNRLQIEAARTKIHSLGGQRIAVLGLSFKPYTDDVRESPTIELVRQLWEDGLDVLVHDPDIRLDDMLGSNRAHLERQLPQIRQIARPTLAETLIAADIVVVSHRRPEFSEALQRVDGARVIDLVGIDPATAATTSGLYYGMSW